MFISVECTFTKFTQQLTIAQPTNSDKAIEKRRIKTTYSPLNQLFLTCQTDMTKW